MELIVFNNELEFYKDFPDFHFYRRHGDWRLVIGYTNQNGEPRVRKYVNEEPINFMERQVAESWYKHLGSEPIIEIYGNTLIVDMPWLGYELRELARYYEKGETAEIGFNGFTPEKATQMLTNTYLQHRIFADTYNLLHLDFWINGGDRPFNITYHPDLDYFPFIDAESFVEATPENWRHFETDFAKFAKFVMTELVA